MTATTEILTGEGVILDTRPASFATRIASTLIDLVAMFLLAIILFNVLLHPTYSLAYLRSAIITGIFLLLVALPTFVETITRGRSLGKYITGLSIVRDDGGPITFRHAAVRWLVAIGEIWLCFGSIAFLVLAFSAKGKRLGDILAGTRAVRVRAPVPPPLQLIGPPALATWARSADIPRLPDSLALAARQFLSRADRLGPAARQQLASELATEIARRVSPQAPACHPEDLVAAVVAERRDRELSRLRADQEIIAKHTERTATLPFGM